MRYEVLPKSEQHVAHLADVYVANRTQKGRMFSETTILGYEAENLIRGVIWNAAHVDGCLNPCAAGDGVMRSSTDWEWGTKPRSRHRDF